MNSARQGEGADDHSEGTEEQAGSGEGGEGRGATPVGQQHRPIGVITQLSHKMFCCLTVLVSERKFFMKLCMEHAFIDSFDSCYNFMIC